MDLKKDLELLLNREGALDIRKLRKHPEIKEKVLQKTTFLDKEKNVSLSQRIWHCFHEVESFLLCSCGHERKTFISFMEGYKENCYLPRGQCSCCLKILREKTKKTCLEKYGSDTPFTMRDFQKKVQQTSLEKYGTSHPSQSEKTKEKTRLSFQKKYGVCNVAQSNHFKKRFEKTSLEKYGTSHPMKNESVKNKWKSIILNNDIHPFIRPDVIEKRNNTIKEKYGVENYSQFHIKEIITDIQNPEWWKDFTCSTQIVCILENYLSISNIYIYINRYRPDLIGTGFKITKPHQKIIDTIQDSIQQDSIQEEMIINDRKSIFPLELDIFIPKFNLAIEVNGVFYHSAKTKSDIPLYQYKHQRKTLLCNEKGISLIQVTDLDIEQKFEKIQKLLDYRINSFSSQKIHARNCQVELIDTKMAMDFCNHYHYNGYVNSTYKIGLFYNNELISVMTIRKSRYFNNSRNYWEIIRFCSSYVILGGFSKMIGFFRRMISSEPIISYVDLSLGHTGISYEKTGFQLVKITEPGYIWIDKDLNIFSRYQMQKQQLRKRFCDYDDSSENDFLFSKGYWKYYDCGHKLYLLK